MGENIFKRLQAISLEIASVAKNLNVGVGKSSYKAVGEADVLAAVKPIEEKHGVYSFPVSRRVIESGELVSQSAYNGQTTERKSLYLRLETTYRFVNVDEPTEYVDMVTFADGVDTQDKAPGKAMTYSDKYALLKAYKIVTGEDPDQYASEPLASAKINATKAKALTDTLSKLKVNIPELCRKFGVASIADLNEEQHAKIIAMINNGTRK